MEKSMPWGCDVVNISNNHLGTFLTKATGTSQANALCSTYTIHSSRIQRPSSYWCVSAVLQPSIRGRGRTIDKYSASVPNAWLRHTSIANVQKLFQERTVSSSQAHYCLDDSTIRSRVTTKGMQWALHQPWPRQNMQTSANSSGGDSICAYNLSLFDKLRHCRSKKFATIGAWSRRSLVERRGCQGNLWQLRPCPSVFVLHLPQAWHASCWLPLLLPRSCALCSLSDDPPAHFAFLSCQQIEDFSFFHFSFTFSMHFMLLWI